MKNVVEKITGAGNARVLVTERGASFGYNTLVSDMRALPELAKTGAPVIFDATHSVQQPGGQGTSSGGQREFVPVLARAAVAVGVAGVFIETHQDPDHAPSDGPNMIALKDLEPLLKKLMAFDRLAKADADGVPERTQIRQLISEMKNRELAVIALLVFVTSLFTRSVDPVVPQIADGLLVDVGTAALAVDRLRAALCDRSAGARRARRHDEQDAADEHLSRAARPVGCGKRFRTELYGVGDFPIVGRHRVGRYFSDLAGACRRPHPDGAAAGRHRPAAGRDHDRQSAGCLAGRRRRRSCRLAGRLRRGRLDGRLSASSRS